MEQFLIDYIGIGSLVMLTVAIATALIPVIGVLGNTLLHIVVAPWVIGSHLWRHRQRKDLLIHPNGKVRCPDCKCSDIIELSVGPGFFNCACIGCLNQYNVCAVDGSISERQGKIALDRLHRTEVVRHNEWNEKCKGRKAICSV